ncbi:hypothetical protein F4811DRAFT_546782 [Daldinia bambusicola]|nr:hypothetical protein F4811DRAFT_546782 [Daldinia bambusicola]
MFKDVQVHCPSAAAQQAFEKCYDDNALDNCENKPGPDRRMCEQLWMIWCGKTRLPSLFLPSAPLTPSPLRPRSLHELTPSNFAGQGAGCEVTDS